MTESLKAYATAATKQLKVTQIRSGVGGKENQRQTLHTLGLRKIGQHVVRENRPEVLGMIATVAHLVTVEEVD
ncbi:MAG TPA: 50S ribosomal protein L30 [Actinopolymorphaceae bacterium]|jgi:large subunit ribosomal protein L30